MSTDVQGGRPLGRFRVLGFPVHIDLTFVLFVGFLGFSQGLTLSELVVWVLVAVVSVLLHELGHAVLARRTGASPAITLMAMGGVTTYAPPRQLSRLESLGISLAGPAVGLVLGGALVLLRPDEDPPGLVGFALRAAIFTTVGWSLFNLLPIVPLDGGQALRELLPGDPIARAKRAAVVSIVLAVVLALVALQNNWIGTFGLVLAAFLVLANVMQLRGLSAARRRRTRSRAGTVPAKGTRSCGCCGRAGRLRRELFWRAWRSSRAPRVRTPISPCTAPSWRRPASASKGSPCCTRSGPGARATSTSRAS